MSAPLITQPGAYPGVSAEDYHGNPNLLPGHSLSASGGKVLLGQSPFHFWASSPMNPARPERPEQTHFNVGKAAHDMLLLADRWADGYFVLPHGFNAAHSKKFAEAIEARDHALSKGRTVLSWQENEIVCNVAEAIGMSELAGIALSNGEPELTIAWQDADTGVWLRCRPDWLPNSVIHGGAVRVVNDLKFMASSHCSPAGFSTAIDKFSYHLSAAFYFDGIKAVYGAEPTHWLHTVVEKEFPFSVSLYPLPSADIARGRHQKKIAVRTFADCLMAGKWPGYADEPTEVGLPIWARKTIDEFGTRQAAAMINAQAGE